MPRSSICTESLSGWKKSEDELAAKLGRVLDLNERQNGLESRLIGILAEAI
jgi:hypothetical protein